MVVGDAPMFVGSVWNFHELLRLTVLMFRVVDENWFAPQTKPRTVMVGFGPASPPRSQRHRIGRTALGVNVRADPVADQSEGERPAIDARGRDDGWID